MDDIKIDIIPEETEKEITLEKEEIVLGINPIGTKEINANGLYDVTNYINANVQVPEPNLGMKQIIKNGIYKASEENFDGYSEVEVAIPEPKLRDKKITENGIYKASDDDLDGYSEVNIETSGVDINDYVSTTISHPTFSNYQNFYMTMLGNFIKKLPIITIDSTKTNLAYLFSEFIGNEIKFSEKSDTSNVTNMQYIFRRCLNLETLDLSSFDTSSVTNMSNCFYFCNKLQKIEGNIKANKVEDISYIFYNCYNLAEFGGFENLGENYKTSSSANYSSYELSLTSANSLEHDSLINIINKLYDIKTKGCNAQSLKLGSSNLAKLTSEEILIATNKGWNVS